MRLYRTLGLGHSRECRFCTEGVSKVYTLKLVPVVRTRRKSVSSVYGKYALPKVKFLQLQG